MTTPLTKRAQSLLKTLIEKHISEGQPVGSKTLAHDSGLSLSPATIRNVLSELEKAGYIIAPHTSSGRVPTLRGYRFFVDRLLTMKPLSPHDIDYYQQQLSSEQNISELVNSTSSLLSDLTHMVGLVTLPHQEHWVLSHLEFLPLSDKRILCVLVFNNTEVQNRIIQTDHDYTREELTQAANYLNDVFSGQDFLTVRKQLCQAMQSDKDKMNALMQRAITIADKALHDTESNKGYVLSGQSHLINHSSETKIDNLRQLFEAFAQKQGILDLLDRCFTARGIQIFIGSETHYQVLGEDYSLVTSTYSREGNPVGVLGVIGPTRMPYDRIIPIVDVTAKIMTTVLNQ